MIRMTVSEMDWVRGFSYKLKRLLDEWGMTQKELAEETGISEATISRCLNGECMPSIKTVVNIGYALGCDTGDLINFYDKID